MELKGQVILDKDTMYKLKSEIRKEVIEEIAKNGNFQGEIEKYMISCEPRYYIGMIQRIIPNMLLKMNNKDGRYNYDKTYLQTLSIKTMLDI